MEEWPILNRNTKVRFLPSPSAMICCYQCCQRERWPHRGVATTVALCDICHREMPCSNISSKSVMALPEVEPTNGWRPVFVDGSVDRAKHGVLAVVSKSFIRIKGSFLDTTSSLMEYQAAIDAIKTWRKDNLRVYCDWVSLVEQMMDKKKPGNQRLGSLWEMTNSLLTGRRVVFEWIGRDQNKAGTFLEMIRNRFTKRTKLWPETINIKIEDWGGE